MNETTGTFYFLNNDTVLLILTNYIPEARWDQGFYVNQLFVPPLITGIFNQSSWNHPHWPHTLNWTWIFILCQIRLRLTMRSQTHASINTDWWSLMLPVLSVNHVSRWSSCLMRGRTTIHTAIAIITDNRPNSQSHNAPVPYPRMHQSHSPHCTNL